MKGGAAVNLDGFVGDLIAVTLGNIVGSVRVLYRG
jgi:hypothetical protein